MQRQWSLCMHSTAQDAYRATRGLNYIMESSKSAVLISAFVNLCHQAGGCDALDSSTTSYALSEVCEQSFMLYDYLYICFHHKLVESTLTY